MLDAIMTKMEKHYRDQRNKGLGVSVLGFSLAVSSVFLDSSFNNQISAIMLISGHLLAVIGIYIYLKAFFSGLNYLKSEQYKKDITAQQPWE